MKALLTQTSPTSRQRAAELLEQLSVYHQGLHNTRLVIEILALQALLYDSQGEGTAALESLTSALQLAEPSGFIRPFVDLGPSMADLLKRLHRKKIARDYIGNILVAFE